MRWLLCFCVKCFVFISSPSFSGVTVDVNAKVIDVAKLSIISVYIKDSNVVKKMVSKKAKIVYSEGEGFSLVSYQPLIIKVIPPSGGGILALNARVSNSIDLFSIENERARFDNITLIIDKKIMRNKDSYLLDYKRIYDILFDGDLYFFDKVSKSLYVGEVEFVVNY